jgi:predicted patatin/cPLA2 family phospholipase
MKIGLVLEGGAMRGMYTAGVLDVFLENKIKVDGIIGVSAGVLFGVNYLSKQKGRVIRYNKKYSKDKRYMGLHSLVKTGNIINKDFAYYEVPTKLDVFDQKTYSESNIPFYATVTNVETGEAEYIKVDDVFLQMELLRATSAMPIVSRIVEIDGKKYLDGAIADSIPIDKMKELGYDKIIVVLTKPKGYKKKKRGNALTKLFYRKYPMFARTMQNRYRNYNQTIDKISDMESQKEIFVIRPSREVKMSRIEKNPDKLQEMYDLGIKDCQNTIKDLKKYIRK